MSSEREMTDSEPDTEAWKNESLPIDKLDFEAELMAIAPEQTDTPVRHARAPATTRYRMDSMAGSSSFAAPTT